MRRSSAVSEKRMPGLKLSRIVVRRSFEPGSKHRGRLHAGASVIVASVGKAGISHRKREGDGATPVGTYLLRPGFYRADKLPRPSWRGRLRPTEKKLGWCDDARSFLYNRQTPVEQRISHERLWREDNVYDIVIPTSHNECPRKLGAGSAIFFHLTRPGRPGTEGCVAISLPDMRRLLPRLAGKVRLVIAD